MSFMSPNKALEPTGDEAGCSLHVALAAGGSAPSRYARES